MFNYIVGAAGHSNNASPTARSESEYTCTTEATTDADRSPSRYSIRSQSCSSSYSEATSCASTSSSAVKSRQINNLKLEVELRDHRIAELEAAVNDTQRMAECSQGELSAKLEEQMMQSQKVCKDQEFLKETVTTQAQQLEEMRKAHEALMTTFQTMASHCQLLEKQREEEHKIKQQQEEFAADRAEFEKMEVHTRRAVTAECDDMWEVLMGEASLAKRRAAIAEKARIQIEQEEAQMLQAAIAQKRAQMAQQQQQTPQKYYPAPGAATPSQNTTNAVRPIMSPQQQQQQRPVAQQQQEQKKCVIM